MAFAKKKSSCIGCKAVLDDDGMLYSLNIFSLSPIMCEKAY